MSHRSKSKSKCHCRRLKCKGLRKRAKKTFLAGFNCCSDFRNVLTCG